MSENTESRTTAKDLFEIRESAARVLADGRLSLSRKIGGFLDLLRNWLQAERASIALLDQTGKSLWIRYSPQQKIVGQRINLEASCVASKVFSTNKPLIIDDIRQFGDIKSLGVYRTNSCMSLPISVHGKRIAVINFADKVSGSAFVPEDVETVSSLSNDSLGIFLENARLYENIKADRSKLRKKNHELKQLMKWRDEVVQMIVHDLKSPISEVLANLDLLREESLSEPGSESLDAALMGCDDLIRMVNNLLDVSKMQARKMVLKSGRLDLISVMRGVAARLKPLAGLKNVRIVEKWPAGPLEVLADETLLTRAMVNLLENSIKYSPEGGKVEVRGKTVRGYHIVEFRDYGPGVPAEYQKSIFETYVQGPSPTGGAMGFGLGLAMSRMAAHNHGGKITLTSRTGKGSTFRLHLPAFEKQT
jgi:K+-sensing histidine kinase KdpD